MLLLSRKQKAKTTRPGSSYSRQPWWSTAGAQTLLKLVVFAGGGWLLVTVLMSFIGAFPLFAVESESHGQSHLRADAITRSSALETLPVPLSSESRSTVGQPNGAPMAISHLRQKWFEMRQTCPSDGYMKDAVPLSSLKQICDPKRLDKTFKVGSDCNNCEDCVKYGEKEPMVKVYRESTDERMAQLQTELLDSVGDANGDSEPLLLMVMNHGYSWLFLNWVCSLQAHSIEDNIRQRTLVVVSDEKAKELVEAAGFVAHYPKWLGEYLDKIEEKPAISFGLGAHRFLVSIQIMLLNDLLHRGYNVILQDLDVIWTANVLQYLSQPRFDLIDVQMSVDLRMDDRGPGNSGFVMVRSSCKSRAFLNTMVNLLHLVLVARSDQNLWNVLIVEKWFRQLHFELLSTDRFVGGHQVSLSQSSATGLKLQGGELPSAMLFMHAAWTTDQMDKVEKFYRTGHWYFQDTCSHFDARLLPDVAYRRKHVAEKEHVQKQRLWLLDKGLVRDSGVNPGV